MPQMNEMDEKEWTNQGSCAAGAGGSQTAGFRVMIQDKPGFASRRILPYAAGVKKVLFPMSWNENARSRAGAWIVGARKVLSAAAILVLGSTLAGCMSSTTYGTGESPGLSVIKGATGSLTGLSGSKKKEIEHKPRAPLVMPPEKTLRQPVTAAAEADPNWPVEAGAPGTEFEDPLNQTSRTDPEYLNRLKPLAGALPSEKKKQRPGYDIDRELKELHVESLRNRDARKKFKAALDDAEGLNSEGRRYLTDPPDKFRTPAETAPQEFDEIETSKKGGFGNFFNFMRKPR